ncbi:TlyA family RNA methyltransferase [Isoptericola sp. NEAU-Y5]|uniref:TlyA family RNA methyltransferase n=1 Tax=Isoptericola luteus TaxID=2879484 RepID=A0ABS7ZEF8_9MICO|nr:TlyA family RNA methyltransferase [Isoptericola sp. NEAU-Y5]MCA5893426.1 TlyA family RNA methyltransferase [Isoptericola sp. NEAU-Y5]
MAPARADAELVRRGLARSRGAAAVLVAAGRVRVGDRVVTKPSTPVAPDAALAVVADADDPEYASRAGGKLAGALDALGADPVGRALTAAIPGARCLDLGASTGGFTDVLLRRGADQVTALDVGHDQLVDRLRADPRVTVVEGFNVRDLTASDLEGAPDVVVGDLSFISLTLVLGPLVAVLGPGSAALLLVKPQFEVGRERLGSGGVVRDPALHVEAVRTVALAAAARGLAPRAVVPSPLPGPSGNREYFCWFDAPATPDAGAHPVHPVHVDLQGLDRAAQAAVDWQPSSSSLPPVLLIEGAQ